MASSIVRLGVFVLLACPAALCAQQLASSQLVGPPSLGSLVPEPVAQELPSIQGGEPGFAVEDVVGTLEVSSGAFGSAQGAHEGTLPLGGLPSESPNTPPVPEPGTAALGALVLGTALRRRLGTGNGNRESGNGNRETGIGNRAAPKPGCHARSTGVPSSQAPKKRPCRQAEAL